MTGTELNNLFDSAINNTKDAKAHWMINSNMALVELKIAKENIQKIIKLILL